MHRTLAKVHTMTVDASCQVRLVAHNQRRVAGATAASLVAAAALRMPQAQTAGWPPTEPGWSHVSNSATTEDNERRM